MKLEFLGGCTEIGREAFLVESRDTRVMLEYGVKLHPKLEIPLLPPKKLHGLFVSHAHLDHSGMAPLLYKTQTPKLYTTPATLDLMNLLLEDYIKVARLIRDFSEYNIYDIKKMNKNFSTQGYNKPFKIGNMDAKLFNTSHIPGSASIFLSGDKKILYTGDINMNPSYLVDYKRIKYPKIDCLITESTYSEKDHPDRKEEEKKFIKKVKEYSHGLVLVPTFAVGRAQELLLMLYKNNITENIYLDGMAQKASDIILYHKNSIKDAKALEEILKKIKFVRTRSQRDKILKNGGIVITTSGMLNGGPIIYYLSKARDKKDTCLLLTGFQVDGTPGSKVLKTGVFESDEDKFKVNIEIKKFDFSGHAGKSELLELIKKTKPEKVVCVHGDNTRKFAREIKENLKIDAVAPKIEENVEI